MNCHWPFRDERHILLFISWIRRASCAVNYNQRWYWTRAMNAPGYWQWLSLLSLNEQRTILPLHSSISKARIIDTSLSITQPTIIDMYTANTMAEVKNARAIMARLMPFTVQLNAHSAINWLLSMASILSQRKNVQIIALKNAQKWCQ